MLDSDADAVLVIVMNYTGDRLNAGIAIETVRAQRRGAAIGLVTVADDCALDDAAESAGKLGVCVLLHLRLWV